MNNSNEDTNLWTKVITPSQQKHKANPNINKIAYQKNHEDTNDTYNLYNDDLSPNQRTIELVALIFIINKFITTPITLELCSTTRPSNLNTAKIH